MSVFFKTEFLRGAFDFSIALLRQLLVMQLTSDVSQLLTSTISLVSSIMSWDFSQTKSEFYTVSLDGSFMFTVSPFALRFVDSVVRATLLGSGKGADSDSRASSVPFFEPGESWSDVVEDTSFLSLFDEV